MFTSLSLSLSYSSSKPNVSSLSLSFLNRLLFFLSLFFLNSLFFFPLPVSFHFYTSFLTLSLFLTKFFLFSLLVLSLFLPVNHVLPSPFSLLLSLSLFFFIFLPRQCYNFVSLIYFWPFFAAFHSCPTATG